ncbi:hypothetical protein [Cystobacter fuscus]|uniref:hypothetical protein n=1 Tax=Cystobacter fuscus TaxID=43 RepID=UPI0012DCE87F|nr:hypothetical protein [Cystobacter fuscus]
MRLLSALFLIAIMAVVAWLAREDETRATAMKCFQLEEHELRGRLDTLGASLMPPPDPAMRHVVHMRFLEEQGWMQGSTFVIRSHRMDSVLYLGPAAPEIALAVDSALSTEGGYDILSFMLFRTDRGQMCLWSGDLGFPFWEKSRKVTVRLLSERRINEDGIVQTYDVEFDG